MIFYLNPIALNFHKIHGMKYLIAIIISISIFGSAASQSSENIEVLAPLVFERRIEAQDVQLLDVRTPQEYAAGHIVGAKNLDWLQRDTFVEKIKNLAKDRPVYLYCRSGNRSQQAAQYLISEGFGEVVDLRGGYMAWPKKQ